MMRRRQPMPTPTSLRVAGLDLDPIPHLELIDCLLRTVRHKDNGPAGERVDRNTAGREGKCDALPPVSTHGSRPSQPRRSACDGTAPGRSPTSSRTIGANPGVWHAGLEVALARTPA